MRQTRLPRLARRQSPGGFRALTSRDGHRMLSLTRKPGQSIEIDGGIRIIITGIESGNRVRLGIEAPAGVAILRSEVLHAITAKNRESVASPTMLEWVGPPSLSPSATEPEDRA